MPKSLPGLGIAGFVKADLQIKRYVLLGLEVLGAASFLQSDGVHVALLNLSRNFKRGFDVSRLGGFVTGRPQYHYLHAALREVSAPIRFSCSSQPSIDIKFYI